MDLKKVLITGFSGFTGRHMVKFINDLGNFEPVGMDLRADPAIRSYPVDLRNPVDLDKILAEEKPDYIIHLAGVTKAEKFSDYYEGNVYTALNIFEALVTAGLLDTKILLISSSAVYGRSRRKIVNERVQVHPVNFYGSSKLAMETAAIQFTSNHGLNISIVRPFNLIGPGQSPEFVIPSFIMQLLEIKYRSGKPVIKTGDLSGKRDFIDVEEAIAAYWKVLTRSGTYGIYNIGSGRATSVQDVLDKLIKMIGVKVRQEIEPQRVHRYQIKELVSDNRRIKSLGWFPQKPLENSLEEMIASYKQQYF